MQRRAVRMGAFLSLSFLVGHGQALTTDGSRASLRHPPQIYGTRAYVRRLTEEIIFQAVEGADAFDQNILKYLG